MHNNANYQCKICWNKALTFGVGSIQLIFRIYHCVHPIHANMFSIQMLLHFSQIVPRVCTLVLSLKLHQIKHTINRESQRSSVAMCLFVPWPQEQVAVQQRCSQLEELGLFHVTNQLQRYGHSHAFFHFMQEFLGKQ